MKKLALFTIVFISAALCNTYSQTGVESDTQNNLIEKGSIVVSAGEASSLNSSNAFTDKVKTSNTINTAVGLLATYYILANQGISIYLDYSRIYNKTQENNLNDYIYRKKMLYAGYTYAYALQPRLLVFARFMVGLGAARDKLIQNYSGTQNIINNTALQMGMLFTLGTYISIFKNSLWLLTPSLSYNLTSTRWDNRTSIYSDLLFQATIVASLNYNSLYCKAGKTLAAIALTRYVAGTLFTMTALANPYLNFGSSKDNYKLGGSSHTNKSSGGGINLGIGYYLMDLFALAFVANLYATTQKSLYSTDKFRQNLFFIRAMHHLPMEGWLRNAYGLAFFKLGFSSNTSLYTNTNVETAANNSSWNTIYPDYRSALLASETKNKFLNTGFGVGVGYNYPIAEIVSIYGELQYIISNSKNRDTEQKQNFRDTELEIGVRIDLN